MAEYSYSEYENIFIPHLPQLPNLPHLPQFPHLPQLPQLPHLPQLLYLTFLFSPLSIIDFFVHYRLKYIMKFTVKTLLFCFFVTDPIQQNTL